MTRLLLPMAGVGAAIFGLAAVLLFAREARRLSLGTWFIPWLRHRLATRRARPPGTPIHVLLCVADHFEPHNGRVSDERADRRVDAWATQYPSLFEGFLDADGRPPQHTFFYPLEQYCERHVAAIAELCRRGFGEVEVHLHHDHDTADHLRQTLVEYKQLLVDRHGLLCRRGPGGEICYGFIHGNWALDNSRPDGRWCGVNNELDVLRETGCYADFTFPSCPSPTQTRTVNSIYYATDDPDRPKSHDTGVEVGSGPAPADALMLIQGPLGFNARSRRWGIVPRVENGCLQASQPPTPDRLDAWLRAAVRVRSRPDWFFVKLYTHGAPEANQAVLLGEPMAALHRELARRAEADGCFHYHYVTAREMYNLARAAEAGWQGSVNAARDFELTRVTDRQPSDEPALPVVEEVQAA